MPDKFKRKEMDTNNDDENTNNYDKRVNLNKGVVYYKAMNEKG